jgi:hypothetical protein
MLETGFGGVDVTVSYTDRYVFSDGVPMPTGRAMANGSRACLITTVRAFIAGRGASRTYNIQLGPSETGNRGVGSAGSAVNTGWQGLSGWFLAQGGSTRMTLNFSGSSYFGRDNGGQGTDSYGRNFGMLGGGYLWAQAPSEPGFVGVYDDQGDGQIRTDFRGSGDDGGMGISGYTLQWATDPGFTQGVGSIITGTGQQTLSNYESGRRYYFRAAARNAVTDAAGTVGPWSNTVSTVAPGLPSAPRNMAASNLTTEFNAVQLTWTAPADVAGGITGYDIWNGTRPIGSTNGTGTSYIARNRPSNAVHSFYVKARNGFADRTGQRSANSNIVDITSAGPPSEPTNVIATSSSTIAGRITVSWSPPVDVGTGITRYSLYSSTGALVSSNISGSSRSYNVDNLTPGTYYAFYLVAWNAISDSVGTPGPKSATVGGDSQGQPNRPTNLVLSQSTAVANRLTLSWVQTGVYTGFNVYEVLPASTVLVGSVKGTSITFDSVSPVSHTYVVSARNAVTEATVPVSEGPRSVAISGTPGTTTSQVVNPVSVSNTTNILFNGSYTLVALTANTLSYAKTSADIAQKAVTTGSVTNNTNTTISGTKTITSVPTANTFTFTQAGLTIAPNTAVSGGLATNLTNLVFNAPATAPAIVTAVDNANRTVSYSRTNANISSRAASGSITNQSNSIYNGTGIAITSVTTNTFTYAKSNSNLAETGATGTVVNTTNQNLYNATAGGLGAVVVVDTPTYNTFTYLRTGADQASTAILDPYGITYRSSSKAILDVKYRSGWAG